jgi:catechol 2,3-dioxygenase-like lactoylglutathione lyase family enzyme
MTIQFHSTGLVVADMARALAFYRALGLSIPAEADQEPHVNVDTGRGLLLFDTVDTIRSFDPQWTDPKGGTRMGLAFECGDPAEVDRTYASLVEAGYEGHLPPWDAFWGQRFAVVKDPDGNDVSICAALS